MTMQEKLTVILDMDASAARGVFEECLSEDGDFGHAVPLAATRLPEPRGY